MPTSVTLARARSAVQLAAAVVAAAEEEEAAEEAAEEAEEDDEGVKGTRTPAVTSVWGHNGAPQPAYKTPPTQETRRESSSPLSKGPPSRTRGLAYKPGATHTVSPPRGSGRT